MTHQLLEECLHGRFLADIDRTLEDFSTGRPKFLCRRRQLGRVSCTKRQPRSLFREKLRDSFADALISAGDDGDFPLEPTHGISSLKLNSGSTAIQRTSRQILEADSLLIDAVLRREFKAQRRESQSAARISGSWARFRLPPEMMPTTVLHDH